MADECNFHKINHNKPYVCFILSYNAYTAAAYHILYYIYCCNKQHKEQIKCRRSEQKWIRTKIVAAEVERIMQTPTYFSTNFNQKICKWRLCIYSALWTLTFTAHTHCMRTNAATNAHFDAKTCCGQQQNTVTKTENEKAAHSLSRSMFVPNEKFKLLLCCVAIRRKPDKETKDMDSKWLRILHISQNTTQNESNSRHICVI